MDEIETPNIRALLNGKVLDENQLFKANREWKNILKLMYELENNKT